MVEENEIEAALDYLRDSAEKAAQATADRKHLEEFRKAKLAMLASDMEGSEAARDRLAHAHPEYLALLDGLKEAVSPKDMVDDIKGDMDFEVGSPYDAVHRGGDALKRGEAAIKKEIQSIKESVERDDDAEAGSSRKGDDGKPPKSGAGGETP